MNDGRNEITTGTLLGGRLAYRQFAAGHRTGFEPVLLAAAIPAQPGDLILEAGTGAGAALLCLAARVPRIRGFGVEICAPLADLANKNFKINGFNGLSCVVSKAEQLPYGGNSFNHVIANPPWFSDQGTAPPDAARALAHQAGPGLLAAWIASLYKTLIHRGTITLILPAAALGNAAAALRALPFGEITLIPLWPRTGEPAKIIILTARKGSNAPDRVHPGLTLHDEHGITAMAQAVLRDGSALT